MADVVSELQLRITANASAADRSIQALAHKLDTLSQSLGRFSSGNAQAVATSLQNIATQANASSASITSLGNAMKRVNGTNGGVTTTATAFGKLSTNISNVSKASSGNVFTRIISFFNKGSNSATSFAAAVGRLYGEFWALMRIARLFSKAFSLSSDLTEVQNVVDQTFGDFRYKLDDLLSSSIENYGMGRLQTSQIASRFQAMGVSAGFTQEKMADMSVTLTKLAADMGSFYNQDYEEVGTKLQSIFTGTTKPLRSYGIDLTNATIENWALTQGLDVQMKKLSQSEKIWLRYQYVLAQTGHIEGDFIRTQYTWANQVRLLKENFKELGTTVGTMLVNTFRPFIIGLNNVVKAVQRFATIVLNALGEIFGWEYQEGGGANLDDYIDGMEDLDDATGSAADSAKKLNANLQGFDRLNVLTTKTSSDSGSGIGDLADDFEASAGKFIRTEPIWKKYESDIKTLEDLGKYISDIFKNNLESIDWDGLKDKMYAFGKNLADFLNGFNYDPQLFYDAGQTVVETFNAIQSAIAGFGDNFDFAQYGKDIGAFINGITENVDWKLAFHNADTWGAGIADAINNFASELNGEALGETLANAINLPVRFANGFAKKIDGKEIGRKVVQTVGSFFEHLDYAEFGDTLGNIADAILDFLSGAIDEVKWDELPQKIADKFIEFLTGHDWKQTFKKAIKLIGKIGDAIWEMLKSSVTLEINGKEIELSGLSLVLGIGAIMLLANGVKTALSAAAIGKVVASQLGAGAAGTGIGASLLGTAGAAITLGATLVVATKFVSDANNYMSGYEEETGKTANSVFDVMFDNSGSANAYKQKYAASKGVRPATSGGQYTSTGAFDSLLEDLEFVGGKVSTFFMETLPNFVNNAKGGTTVHGDARGGGGGFFSPLDMGIEELNLDIGNTETLIADTLPKIQQNFEKYMPPSARNANDLADALQNAKDKSNALKADTEDDTGKISLSFESVQQNIAEQTENIIASLGEFATSSYNTAVRIRKHANHEKTSLETIKKEADRNVGPVPALLDKMASSAGNVDTKVEGASNSTETFTGRVKTLLEHYNDKTFKLSTQLNGFDSANSVLANAVSYVQSLISVNGRTIYVNVNAKANFSLAEDYQKYLTDNDYSAGTTRASGGFVRTGQLFSARENGIPELVGRIGHTTAVANNDQIVQAVAIGVASAVESTLAPYMQAGQNVNVNLVGDAKGVFKMVQDQSSAYRTRTGRSAFA